MGKLKWINSDHIPDQSGRAVPNQEGVFEFKRKINPNKEDAYLKVKVDLGEYKLREVEKRISKFGFTVFKGTKDKQYVFESVPDPSWVIAERIFESEI